MTPAFQPASAWTDAFLDAKREKGDPLADSVIENLFASHSVAAVNDLMRNLVTNEYPEPATLPPVVADYLKQLDTLPAWADRAKIATGEQIFWKYGPRLILILHCYALPFCYLGRNGVQVLALTGRLSGNSTRRIIETAQLLVDVMQPGGLTGAEGRALRTIQKVRLMHAAVRHLIGQYRDWKREYGLPINQEDLAGTLLSFSWISLDGLRKTGIQLSAAEIQAYLHCWQIVGHLLGIDDEVIPRDEVSAASLAAAIARRQFGACEEGKQMTKALLDSIRNQLPGNLLDDAPALLMRYFLGDAEAEMLGLGNPPAGESGLRSLFSLNLDAEGAAVSDLLHDSALVSDLATKLGNLLVNSIVLVGRAGNKPSFAIPQELCQQWGVNWFS